VNALAPVLANVKSSGTAFTVTFSVVVCVIPADMALTVNT